MLEEKHYMKQLIIIWEEFNIFRIIDGRSTGKTSRLLLLAKENNYAVACMNPEIMRSKAERYGFVGLKIISYKDVMDYPRGAFPNGILVDELEPFIRVILKHDIAGYTMSVE